ncbi:5-formyltetrahydrofolate cyclo-ligase [Cellulomonas fengjieae]|uniref:5-formyltetrahydrofolate cyclo-ligase n=1 Tax=Cellulomonas fengjieae TaxID=2819978 RepID=A0ABS3SM79_9CELL|nr:5-formyltetrahydrofolate cyclo-ligase [Cellulomonas fengjieae]MBO3086594.1 5-formyltetrahydrofolate cyclo-ligase [Cellulomonas fengjieae]QVI66554.1 5-formyltetrahydrofolate cyclo-ligase [Cellulomonas fengjieae]
MSSVAQPYPRVSEGDEVEDVKERLRVAIRDTRKLRSVRLRDAAARELAEVVLAIPAVADARCASVYASRVTEPGTGPLLDALRARGVRLLLPVLGTGLQRDWAEYIRADDLRERAPGRPPEPSGPPLGAAALAEADVVIAPALAVDTSGARLGQGGGWYDRALEHLRPGAPVIALVFPEELYDADERPLPRESHDRLVDAVATPQGWHPITV